MKESDLNTIIKNSFGDPAFAYKIPDPSKAEAITAVQRPFDGFSVGQYGHLYWEAKLLKSYKAFSMALIQPHQIKNLTTIDSYKHEKTYPLVILGVWESRKYFDIYMFDINYILNLIKSGKKSILKIELIALKERYAIEVKNKLFSIDGFENKIIRDLSTEDKDG